MQAPVPCPSPGRGIGSHSDENFTLYILKLYGVSHSLVLPFFPRHIYLRIHRGLLPERLSHEIIQRVSQLGLKPVLTTFQGWRII